MVNFYNYFLNCDNPDCIDWRDCPASAYDVAGKVRPWNVRPRDIDVSQRYLMISGHFCALFDRETHSRSFKLKNYFLLGHFKSTFIRYILMALQLHFRQSKFWSILIWVQVHFSRSYRVFSVSFNVLIKYEFVP